MNELTVFTNYAFGEIRALQINGVEYVIIVLDNGNVIYDRKWTQAGKDFVFNLIRNLEFSKKVNNTNVNGVK